MGDNKGGFYETFDSGAGPVIPEGCAKDFDHNDSASALSDSDDHGSVPEVPQGKK